MLYAVTVVAVLPLRVGGLRLLERVPPAWSYSVESGPKMPRMALNVRVLTQFNTRPASSLSRRVTSYLLTT